MITSAASVALLTLASVLAFVYLVGFCWRGPSVAKSVTKVGAVLPLSVLAFTSGSPVLLVLALLACALGDFLLSLDREPAFLAGVGAFALGHLLFVGVIVGHPEFSLDLVATSPRRDVVAGMCLLAIFMAWVLWRNAGPLRVAVLGYVVVILSMGIAVMALPGQDGLVLAMIGGGLFMVSDTLLALDMFVLRGNGSARRIVPFAVWASYWSAIVGLMFGLS